MEIHSVYFLHLTFDVFCFEMATLREIRLFGKTFASTQMQGNVS